jgi:hypothetical protein
LLEDTLLWCLWSWILMIFTSQTNASVHRDRAWLPIFPLPSTSREIFTSSNHNHVLLVLNRKLESVALGEIHSELRLQQKHKVTLILWTQLISCLSTQHQLSNVSLKICDQKKDRSIASNTTAKNSNSL